MKKIFSLLILSFFSIITLAQNKVYITADAGQLFSNFRYLDAEGVKDKDYNTIINGTYNIGCAKHFENGLIIKSTLGNRKSGASMVYNEVNYVWNLQYLDIKAGAGYKFDKLIGYYFFDKWRLQPYVIGSPFISYLLKANQSLNGINYDIKKSKVLKNTDFGIVTTGGINILVSTNFSVFAEFNYLVGLQNIETKSNNQKLNNRAYSINIGLAVNIK